MRRSRAILQVFTLIGVIGAIGCTEEGGGVPGFLLPCDDPAPWIGPPPSSASTIVVTLHDGVDTAAEAARLADACRFEVLAVNDSSQFAARLDIVELGCVRCDPAVISVETLIVYTPF